MNRQEKSQEVDDLKALFGDAQLMVLTKYIGLNVGEITTLRSNLRKAHAGFRVVKNTLARLATAGTDLEGLHPHFTGPIAVAYAKEDAAAAAKAVSDFAEDHPKLEITAGCLPGGQVLGVAEVETLAKLPGKDQLRGQLLGVLKAVPRNFVGLLSAPPRNLVGVLAARQRQLEEA